MSQCETLLAALKRGERLNPMESIKKYGVRALSQRMTDLKRRGYNIRTDMLKIGKRTSVAEYTLVRK